MNYGGLAHPAYLVEMPVMKGFSADLVKSDFTAGDGELAERAQRDRETQAAVIQTMQDAVQDGLKPSGATVHWRFAVLAAAALALQVRRDRPADETTTTLLLQGLNSDILALRQLCRAVLPVLFLTEQASVADDMEIEKNGPDLMSNDADVLSPEDFEASLPEGYAGPFKDVTWVGWNRMIDDNARSANAPVFAQAVTAVLASSEWIQGTLSKTSQDHRLSGDERAESKTGGATMPLASAGIQAACDARWLWPRTSAASLSADFSKNTMMTIEYIVAASGVPGVDALWVS